MTKNETKKREVSDAKKAAAIYDKLTKLDAEMQEELAQSPQQIRQRYEERRAKLLSVTAPTVRAIVERMQGPAAGSG